MKRRLLLFVFAFIIVFGSNVCANQTLKIQNPGFEEASSGKADFWIENAWNKAAGYTTYKVDATVHHSGKSSGLIDNTNKNDARYEQAIRVDANSYYKFSCWIKTENIGKDSKGANISAVGILETSNQINGTNNQWQHAVLYGKTADGQSSLSLTLGVGGYGSENTGKAWFDDVTVEKLDQLPSGAIAVSLDKPNQDNTEPEKPLTHEQKTSNDYNMLMLIYSALFLIAVCIIYYQIKKGRIKTKHGVIILGILLAAGFIFRLIVAPMIEGWPNDISANKSWAASAANDLTNIYSGWVDYPPFFMYVFFIVGKISAFLGQSQVSTLLIKLPSIIADLVTAFMLFKLAKKQFGMELGLLAAAVYAFNPIVFLDSTIWGQVDSFFTMIVVGALILLMKKNIKWATVLFVVAVLMKPQGVFFFPVIVFELVMVVLIKQKNIKEFLLSVLYGIGTVLVIILPFTLNKSPIWIVELYMKTAGEYTSAAMNAFNSWGLIGANFKDASTSTFIGLSYNTWGIVLIALILGFCGFIYWKSKHVATPILVAVILNAGAFIFVTKMHERYMFPVVALLIMAFIYIKDKRIFVLMLGFGITIFFNIQILFARMLAVPAERITESYYPAVYIWTIVFGIVNIAMFGYLIWITWDVFIRNKTRSVVFASKAGGKGNVGAIKTDTKKVETKKTYSSGPKNNTDKNISIDAFSETPKIAPKISKLKIDKKDIIIMCSMTLIYLVIALFNLGSFSAPQTSWQPMTVGKAFTVDFGKEVDLARVYLYVGVAEGDSGKYRLEYAGNDKKFNNLETTDTTKKLNTLWVFEVNTWYIYPVSQKARYVNVIVDSPTGTLNEMVFTENGKTQPITGFKIIDNSKDFNQVGTINNLFDEQSTLEYNPTYLTSTYFDEIYHARTAYQYLHGMEPYENTHPPLGKLLIAVGISIFGMTGFGWRIVGTLFGALMIPLMYMFAKKMFDKRFYGFAAAFLMMFDFMHFVQTRISTIDVYVTFFVIVMYYFMYDYFMNKSYVIGLKASLKPLFLSGLFFGIGAACKWIALYGAGGLALLFFLSRLLEYRDYRKITKNSNYRKEIKKNKSKFEWINNFMSHHIIYTILFAGLFFIIIPAIIYFASYIPYMNAGNGHKFSEVLSAQAGMYDYHAHLEAPGAAFQSPWWSWPLDNIPYWYYQGKLLAQDKISTIVAFGNPAIWWAGILAFFAALGIAIAKKEKKMVVIFSAILFQYFTWVFVSRVVYIYHFFSTVPFMILAMVYVFKTAMDKYVNAKYAVYLYLAIVLLLFILFYPVISGLVVDKSYLKSLHWISSWPGFS
ncbi:MAG: glycosyltransferase family 39 protein [Clostridia bacterium]|jgi:Gpi18-like mannosyltransferase